MEYARLCVRRGRRGEMDLYDDDPSASSGYRSCQRDRAGLSSVARPHLLGSGLPEIRHRTAYPGPDSGSEAAGGLCRRRPRSPHRAPHGARHRGAVPDVGDQLGRSGDGNPPPLIVHRYHRPLSGSRRSFDRPWVHPQDPGTVRWTEGMHPHDGAAAGHGPGCHSVGLVHAGHAGRGRHRGADTATHQPDR